MGAYEIDASNLINVQGLICKIAHKLELVRNDEDLVIEMLDQKEDIIIVINDTS